MALITMKRKINNYAHVLLNITIILILGLYYCSYLKSEQVVDCSSVRVVDDKEVNERNFVEKGDLFIIRFSAILDDTVKPCILIPIYGGVGGIARYSQLASKRKGSVSILGGIVIETQPGKVKETIIDCVNFYKKSLLKNADIEKPTVIGIEGYGLFIWYDYDYMGRPGIIMIGCGADPECENKPSKCMYKFLKDIEVNEKANMFYLSIDIGSKSRWREKREKEGTWK